MDQYNWDDRPPFIINVTDDHVIFITDGQNPQDPLQSFLFPHKIWDAMVEYVKKVKVESPDSPREPFLASPRWEEIIPPRE